MLPDFRFVLGAILAVALIAVAGLGLVTSVRLAHEARIGPLDDSRSLAYAGHAEWNQFYDPDGARRFEGVVGKTEAAAGGETRLAPPAEPGERTASIPTTRHDPEIAPAIAPVIANDAPETDPPRADPPPETAPAVTIAAPQAEPMSAPAPNASALDAASTPPAERVASAPATLPGPDRAEDAPTVAPTQPQASGDAPPDPSPPTPRARPKFQFHKNVVRAHIHRVAAFRQQAGQNPGLWPGYANQFGTAGRKSSGLFTGTLASRPQ